MSKGSYLVRYVCTSKTKKGNISQVKSSSNGDR
jgi:hypothetical protein